MLDSLSGLSARLEDVLPKKFFLLSLLYSFKLHFNIYFFFFQIFFLPRGKICGKKGTIERLQESFKGRKIPGLSAKVTIGIKFQAGRWNYLP